MNNLDQSPIVDSNRSDWSWYAWVLLVGVRDGISNIRRKALSKHGISPIQGAVLMIVDRMGRQATPTEISRWLHRKPHAISMLVDRMEKSGLVNKVKDLERKNYVRVVMTEKGRDLYQKSLLARETIFGIMNTMNKEELYQLVSMLERLFKVIDYEPEYRIWERPMSLRPGKQINEQADL